MEAVIPIISQIGFPIFVALYVLFRMEKTINENTKAIQSLMSIVKNRL